MFETCYRMRRLLNRGLTCRKKGRSFSILILPGGHSVQVINMNSPYGLWGRRHHAFYSLLLIQLPATKIGKVAEDGPTPWVSGIKWESQMDYRALGSNPDQSLLLWPFRRPTCAWTSSVFSTHPLSVALLLK